MIPIGANHHSKGAFGPTWTQVTCFRSVPPFLLLSHKPTWDKGALVECSGMQDSLSNTMRGAGIS
jgi:hypothetical protein